MRVFVIFIRLLQCLQKKLSSTKVNVNYVESSNDIFKFYQRVLNVEATISNNKLITLSNTSISYFGGINSISSSSLNETVISITEF